MSSADRFRPNIRVLKRFVRWIEQPQFDPRFAKKWGQLYRANAEAAMCEATYWDILCGFGVEVKPNDLGDGSSAPDYICTKNGVKFYVEVTCICLDTATDATSLDAFGVGASQFQHFDSLNQAITNECRDKVKQCANLDAPCLVAIGTFHFEASALVINETCVGELLTDEPKITMKFDPTAGQCVGDAYQSTDFRGAAFTRNRDADIKHIRQTISGLLVGGFGTQKAKLFGVLHPEARRPFNRSLLSQVEFCRLKIDRLDNTVSAEWS